MLAAVIIFWLCLAVLFYTFAGYPLLMRCLAGLREAATPRANSSPLPSATVILAAHNEAGRILPRLQNLLASHYPENQLNIIVVSDGSTDDTVRQIQSLDHPRVQLIIQPQRLGKAHALNLAAAAATGDLLVFADVRQNFAPATIAQLAGHFGGLQIGAVSGELIIDPAASAVGGGVDFYWKLERFLRYAESRWDSSIGCTGAVYAIRRALFTPLPADTILDDVVIPMRIAAQGFRVAFDPAARAFDPQSLEPHREQVRKRRTLAGNYQMLFRHPDWLLPWRHRLWWQLLSHKYLRLAAPFFLLLLFVANAALLGHGLYRWLFAGQCLFYALALSRLVFPSPKFFLFSLPAGFVFLNWQAALALWQYLRNPNQSAWQSSQTPNPSPNVQSP